MKLCDTKTNGRATIVKIFVCHPTNTWGLVNIKLCDTKTHGKATMVKMFVSHNNNTWNFVNRI